MSHYSNTADNYVRRMIGYRPGEAVCFRVGAAILGGQTVVMRAAYGNLTGGHR